MKLLQTNTYLLLIDEEAEIQKGDLMYDNHLVGLCNCTKAVNKLPYSYTSSFLNIDKVIAYYHISSEAKELDLPKLPPFKKIIPNSEYEEGMFGYTDTEVRVAQNAFKEGYKAAQSKQYSLEDIEQILFDYDNVDWSKREHKKPTIMMKEWLKEKIQSLSTQQLPVGFIPEPNDIGFIKNADIMVGKKLYDKIMSPFKTIINSEGKEELVGNYVY